MEVYVRYRYSGGAIASEDVLKFLSLTGMSSSVLAEMVRRKEIAKKAAELGIKVTDEQLQNFADSFRSARGLLTAEATTRFLQTWGLSDDDLESFCETAVMAQRVEETMAGDAAIKEYFANNRSEFDLARVSIIVVEKEGLANEIMMQVTQDGEDFHALARKHSVDGTTKYAGGYAGMVTRAMLEPEMAAKVFNVSAGEVVGPFNCDGAYRIIMVEEVMRADVKNDGVKSSVKEAILGRWMSQFLKGGIRAEQG
jgi:hypothetical protein